MMKLLRFSAAIDQINRGFGWIASWLVLLACIISAGNATSRYLFSLSSNAWLEIQWYMFSGMVLLGASYTLKVNEHVRVDLVYANVSERTRLWIDLFGSIVFLLPATLILMWMTWPFFVEFLVPPRDVRQRRRPPALAGQDSAPRRVLLAVAAGHLGTDQAGGGSQGLITLETKYEAPQQ